MRGVQRTLRERHRSHDGFAAAAIDDDEARDDDAMVAADIASERARERAARGGVLCGEEREMES